MQAVTATLRQETTRGRVEWSRLMRVPLSWLTRVFGCWHQEMSRPFTLRAGESYRVCLECGAHRRFNTQTWELVGPYYYEQAVPAEIYSSLNASVKVVRDARQSQKPVLRRAA